MMTLKKIGGWSIGVVVGILAFLTITITTAFAVSMGNTITVNKNLGQSENYKSAVSSLNNALSAINKKLESEKNTANIEIYFEAVKVAFGVSIDKINDTTFLMWIKDSVTGVTYSTTFVYKSDGGDTINNVLFGNDDEDFKLSSLYDYENMMIEYVFELSTQYKTNLDSASAEALANIIPYTSAFDSYFDDTTNTEMVNYFADGTKNKFDYTLDYMWSNKAVLDNSVTYHYQRNDDGSIFYYYTSQDTSTKVAMLESFASLADGSTISTNGVYAGNLAGKLIYDLVKYDFKNPGSWYTMYSQNESFCYGDNGYCSDADEFKSWFTAIKETTGLSKAYTEENWEININAYLSKILREFYIEDTGWYDYHDEVYESYYYEAYERIRKEYWDSKYDEAYDEVDDLISIDASPAYIKVGNNTYKQIDSINGKYPKNLDLYEKKSFLFITYYYYVTANTGDDDFTSSFIDEWNKSGNTFTAYDKVCEAYAIPIATLYAGDPTNFDIKGTADGDIQKEAEAEADLKASTYADEKTGINEILSGKLIEAGLNIDSEYVYYYVGNVKYKLMRLSDKKIYIDMNSKCIVDDNRNFLVDTDLAYTTDGNIINADGEIIVNADGTINPIYNGNIKLCRDGDGYYTIAEYAKLAAQYQYQIDKQIAEENNICYTSSAKKYYILENGSWIEKEFEASTIVDKTIYITNNSVVYIDGDLILGNNAHIIVEEGSVLFINGDLYLNSVVSTGDGEEQIASFSDYTLSTPAISKGTIIVNGNFTYSNKYSGALYTSSWGNSTTALYDVVTGSKHNLDGTFIVNGDVKFETSGGAYQVAGFYWTGSNYGSIEVSVQATFYIDGKYDATTSEYNFGIIYPNASRPSFIFSNELYIGGGNKLIESLNAGGYVFFIVRSKIEIASGFTGIQGNMFSTTDNATETIVNTNGTDFSFSDLRLSIIDRIEDSTTISYEEGTADEWGLCEMLREGLIVGIDSTPVVAS